MKNILCLIFGHQPPVYAKKGWYSPGEEYAKTLYTGTDGCGREHYLVLATCARCEEKKVTIARIHGPLNRGVAE